jgi:hypothetical protein
VVVNLNTVIVYIEKSENYFALVVITMHGQGMPNIRSQQGCAGIRDQCSDRGKGDEGTQVREKNFQKGRKAVFRAEKKGGCKCTK